MMTYRYDESGQEDVSRRVEETESRTGRLRVLFLSKDEGNDYFGTILTANLQRWGYEVAPVNTNALQEAQPESEMTGDILLYDMDVFFQHPALAEKQGREPALLQHEQWPGWPRVRLTMVFSSSSVSRHTLERLGAVAWLHKPFDMRALERYLRVFQRLLYGESQAGEASKLSKLAIVEQGSGEELAEGSDKASPAVTRVLVADDLKEVTWGIRQCLIEQGNQRYHYEVRVVHDGLALLDECLSWQPHCVVTDLLMPWLNGYQVIRCLASEGRGPVPAFVVISALMRHEFLADRSLLQDQRVRYMEKPFDSDNLLSIIEQELARQSDQQFGICG